MSNKYKKIFIASDHAGLEMKRHLIARHPELPFVDLGPSSGDSVDYPDYAAKLCQELEKHLADSIGVLVCGSGQGMAIRANRFPFVRAALCWNAEIAQLARAHNDANVLCLAGRHLVFPVADEILKVFLSTPFEGGRHQKRVDKL
ncbi:MAG TPA: RpiB/LacA/LacB family sugar-phosphate isomerase [Bdellovibrionales bacterium]|nr:RpiB/LacA/LacB family sugar-phosphate isomerase [Bdellovibrionales bacterium]